MEENEESKNLYNHWNVLKQCLEFSAKDTLFKEGQVWWINIGQNLGGESYGKGRLFSRPVLVYRKLSTELFIGIPLTSKIKHGTWFVGVRHREKKVTALLHQIRVFDRKRLLNSMGHLDDEDYRKIKTGLRDLLI